MRKIVFKIIPLFYDENTFGPMSHIITIGKRYDIVDQRIIGDVKYFVFIGDDGLKHVSSEENLFSQCEFREYQLNKII
jgi:hypothetical protein